MNISVIIPVYNCEKYIQESINSVLRDIEFHDEILICNDCSTDNSLSEIGLIKDERIKIFTNDKNRGIAYTLNRLVAVAKNEIIARMDADDVADKFRIEKQLNYLKRSATNTGLQNSGRKVCHRSRFFQRSLIYFCAR